MISLERLQILYQDELCFSLVWVDLKISRIGNVYLNTYIIYIYNTKNIEISKDNNLIDNLTLSLAEGLDLEKKDIQ